MSDNLLEASVIFALFLAVLYAVLAIRHMWRR